jgi:hypothetical protein
MAMEIRRTMMVRDFAIEVAVSHVAQGVARVRDAIERPASRFRAVCEVEDEVIGEGKICAPFFAMVRAELLFDAGCLPCELFEMRRVGFSSARQL